MALNYAMILAGGSGSRLENKIPKAFIKINHRYLLEYSLIQFNLHSQIDKIILVVPQDYLVLTQKIVKENSYQKVIHIVMGGPSRFDSSRNGLRNIEDLESRVLIHDAARPFISESIISNCLKNLKYSEAVNVLAPISDTLVELDQHKIQKAIDRNNIRQVQTPQGFIVKSIKKAQEMALNLPHQDISDDFNLVLKYQTGRTSWIEGSRMNFKITYPEDFRLAQAILMNQK